MLRFHIGNVVVRSPNPLNYLSMTNLVKITSKSDIIGAVASTLCFLHCLAAPILFVAQAGLAVGGEAHPWWWGALDTLFLGISLLAVYWSAQKTTKLWIRYAFWSLWIFLAIVILNEKLGILHLPEEIIYFPTLGLIALHFYNRHYCSCTDDTCCVD